MQQQRPAGGGGLLNLLLCVDIYVKILLLPEDVPRDLAAAEAGRADQEELDNPHHDVDGVEETEVEPVDAEAAEEQGEDEGGELAAAGVLVLVGGPLHPGDRPRQAHSRQQKEHWGAPHHL